MQPLTVALNALSGRMTHFSARTWSTLMTGLMRRLTEGSGTILLSFSFLVSVSQSVWATYGGSLTSATEMGEVKIHQSAESIAASQYTIRSDYSFQ